MRVLFLSENPHTQLGGIENDISHMGKLLESKGISTHYLSAKELNGLVIFKKKIVSKKEIRKRIISIAPDIIHIYGFSSFFINQCLALSKQLFQNTKLIYTPCYHPFGYHRRPLLAFLFFHVFLKKSIQNIDVSIALTQTEKDFFMQYLDDKKIKVIPNGIESISASKQKEKPKETRVLFIGRDDHNKRLDFLTNQKDFFKLRGICCDIVTDKDQVSDEVFTYHNHLSRSELTNLYKKCSLLVVPSKYEAFSIVTLEAMSFGIPVLISDHVQIKTYLAEQKTFSEIFQYNNTKDFVEKLEKIIDTTDEHYMQLSRNNIAFAKQFDWDLIVQETFQLYHG